MSKCGFCYKCDTSKCPKMGRSEMPTLKNIYLSPSIAKKLKEYCNKNDYLEGTDYYKVPNYNLAIGELLKSKKAPKKPLKRKS